jgi:hypothetical protein
LALLRAPGGSAAYGSTARMLDDTRVGARAHGSAAGRHRVRGVIALLVYSTGYPLLALALWTGARDGSWTRASMLVALGVFVSFLGWALLATVDQPDDSEVAAQRESRRFASPLYLALYNRAGAIVVLLGSYAVVARSQGWPTPESFVGWFALVWLPLFVSFAIPVQGASRLGDPNA